jgi:chromosome segregation ATPase
MLVTREDAVAALCWLKSLSILFGQEALEHCNRLTFYTRVLIELDGQDSENDIAKNSASRLRDSIAGLHIPRMREILHDRDAENIKLKAYSEQLNNALTEMRKRYEDANGIVANMRENRLALQIELTNARGVLAKVQERAAQFQAERDEAREHEIAARNEAYERKVLLHNELEAMTRERDTLRRQHANQCVTISEMRAKLDVAHAALQNAYPTEWAYKQACDALEKQREDVRRAGVDIGLLKDIIFTVSKYLKCEMEKFNG